MIRRGEGAEDDGGEGADGQHSSGDHGNLEGLVLREGGLVLTLLPFWPLFVLFVKRL